MLRPIVWCLASAALFGASAPLAKSLLDGVGPITLAGLLYLGAALFVAPLSRRGGSPERRRHPAHVKYLLAAIVFGGIAGPILLMFGLRAASAASVSLWLNLETVATAVLAFALFREHLGWRTWLAVLAVVGGGVALAAPEGFGTLPAALLVAAACACWGLDNNVTALIDGFTPAQATLIKGVVAGAVNVTIGLSIGEPMPVVTDVLIAVCVGGLGYGISIVLYISGAHHLGATRSQVLFATAPFVGVAVAWFAFGEPILPIQIAVAASMIAGIALLMRGHHDHEHHHDALTHTHSHRHDDGHHDHAHPGLPAWIRHTHEHTHTPIVHAHAHTPDLHHRHRH